MANVLGSRQNPASDQCPFVSWDDYDWHRIIQCNVYKHGLKIPWNPAVYCIIAASHAVALYMCLELLVSIFRRFKRWGILYPWALLSCTIGLIGLIVTCDLSIWVLRPGHGAWTALNIICSILWLTGFPLMLYSRLVLILPIEHRRFRQGLLIMIAFNSVAFNVPGITATIIGTYGSQKLAYNISKHAMYIDIGFAGQDVLLSSVYIYYFWQYMNQESTRLSSMVKRQIRKSFVQLLVAYTWVAATTIVSLVLMGKMLLLARYTMLPLVNVLLLKVEFFVLNRLVHTVKIRNEALQEGNISEVLQCEQRADVSYHIAAERTTESFASISEVNCKGGSHVECQCDAVQALPPDGEASHLDNLERQYVGRSSLVVR